MKKKMKTIVIKHQDKDGKFDGNEIHLGVTNDIQKLKNQLMLLGIKGLAYSSWWNDVAQKIKKLEEGDN